MIKQLNTTQVGKTQTDENSRVERFNRVFEHIERHLEPEQGSLDAEHGDSALDLNTLSEIANMSKFHFHRQCSAYFGMTVKRLINLLKLKRAAYQLAYRPDNKIIDIALQAGYNNHESFTRAFSKVFEVSPSGFRTQPEWALWQQQYQSIQRLRKEKMQDHSISQPVDIVQRKAVPIALYTHRGPMQGLMASIQRFIRWRKSHGTPPSQSRTFNIVYDDPNVTPASEYRFGIASELIAPLVSDDPDIVESVIEAGTYAVIRHCGSDDLLEQTINYLYRDWLNNSDYEIKDSPLILERVAFFPDVAEHQAITYVYLPLAEL